MALKIWLPLVDTINNQGTEISNFVNTGASLSTIGPIGKAFSFNGSSNQIYGSYTCGEAEFTTCMWVRFSKLNVHLVDMRNSDGTGYQPFYVSSSSGIQVGGSNSSYIYIDFIPTVDTWYHLCVRSNSSRTQLFVNGEYYGETTSAKATNFNKKIDIHIGSRYSGSNWFGGYICDFRLYNSYLSNYEIRDIAKGLLVHYTRLKSATNADVRDSSGFGRDATANSTIGSGNWSSMRYAYSYTVGSTADQYFYTTSPSSLTKTISFWIRTPKSASTVAFADYKSKLAFGFNASGYIITTCVDWAKPMITNTSAITANVPCHIVLRKSADSTAVETFINGVKQTASGSNNYWSHATDTLMIGRRSTGSQMNCYISDFRMYATRISDDDILDLYRTSLKQMSDGTSWTFELKEDTLGKVQVKSSGLLANNSFVESNSGNKFKATQVLSNKFIER